ncbi:uncharacterized protein EI97DRAFT_429565 [Westerdykella ornata]|uniref:CFEM domain-containing protein n=1 Tax=Westerdykella ornata TaxID=318751 RepID=A0A6A6JZP2_WESOR|nr:uncharacterized protein EI97DRAFT_429565 [Westerdykella ornata]KAF2281553.1 hypothetical protein EI97DRAFT_429565 [Westerdykella ornata]
MHVPDLLVRALIYSSATWDPYPHSKRPTTTVTVDVTTTKTRTPTVTGTTTTVTTSTTTTKVTKPTETGTTTTATHSNMPPSTITILTTSLLTLTTILPTATAQFPGPIEGLPQCAQTIIFERLANSQCNPASFPCICDELARQQVGEAIRRACSESDFAAYQRFVNTICANIRPVVVNTTTTTARINTTTTATPITRIIPLTTTTGGRNVTITTQQQTATGPFANITTTIIPPPTTAVNPTKQQFTTTRISITTTGPQGQPTTLVSETVLPVAPPTETETEAPSAPFEGGAAPGVKGGEVEVFGVRGVWVLGALMGGTGVVFAWL